MIVVLRTSLAATLAMGILAVGGCSSSPCCRPGPTFPGVLHGVSATSATDAWAVGVGRGGTLILHWNGTAWSRMASPSPDRRLQLVAVTATSAANAWAVGFNTTPTGQPRTLIMHWNGTRWSMP